MNNNNKIFSIFAILMVSVFVFIFMFLPKSNARTDLEPFAQCLQQKGAVFYGAFWCSFCQEQKQMFGTAVSKLPYVECSTPDGNSQIQECIDKQIQTYPTWIFEDGSVKTGVIPLQELSQVTDCALP